MLNTIIKKEIVAALRSRQLLVLFVVYAVLLTTAFCVSYASYNQQQKERQHNQEEAYNTWLNQGERNPHNAAHFGTYAYKPITALSFIDGGLNNYTGTQVRLEAHKQNDVLFSAIEDANAGSRFGELNIALVLQLFMPLFIIFLCFSSLSTEREDNTLKLMAGQGINIKTIFWGKVLSNYLIILILVMPLLLVSLFFLKDSNLIGRSILMFLTYLLFFFIVTAGSILVSGYSKNSKSALLVLLSIWAIGVVLIPKAAANIGDDRFPLISKIDFNNNINQDYKNGFDGHNPDSMRLKQMEKDVLKKYKVDSLNQLPVNFEALLMIADEKYHDTVYDRRFGNLQITIRNQNSVGQWVSLFNPFIAARNLSMGFAGTDYEHYVNFHISTETYRRQMMMMLNTYYANNSKTGDYEMKAPETLWKQMPAYKYEFPDWKWVMQKHQLECLSLFIWIILLILLTPLLVKKIAII